MKRVVFFLLLLLAAPAVAGPARLYDGALSFDLPSGFRPMTASEIATKYRTTQQPPEFGFTDDDKLSVTIVASRRAQARLTPDKLATIGEVLQQAIAGRGGVSMHRHGLVSIGGVQWYAMDYGSQSADEPVENRTRLGIRPGYLILVSANAITRVFPQREAELLRVLESLKAE